MQRHAIERRISALEDAMPQRIPNVAIILQWQDGHCAHNGLEYGSIDEALDVLMPDDHIIVDVVDYSKPTTAKE